MKILYPNLRLFVALILVGFLGFQNSFAQSDDCTGTTVAVPTLTVGAACVNIAYSILSTYTFDTTYPPCTPSAPSRNGWFQFTTNASTTNISITASSGSPIGRRISLMLYSGSCGTLVSENCITSATSPNIALMNQPVLSNTTYYLRIVQTNNTPGDMNGDICIVANNPIDNCTTALSLPVNSGGICTTSVDATTVGATQSQVACSGTADDDVWFTLVPTSTTHYITVKGSTLVNPVVQLFSGNCAGLSPILCVNASTSDTENIIASGLTLGATYFVRVYSFGGGGTQGNFNICVTGPDSPAPYCAAEGTNSTCYINNFTTTAALSNISNASGYSDLGYGSYLSQSLIVMPNSTVNFNASFNPYAGDSTYGFNIWVDWNRNNIFDNAEKVYGSGAYVSPANGTFNIPATAVGNYRMRIRAHWLATDPSSCGTIAYGETEDYTLTVQPLLCSTVPGSLNATGITPTTANFNWSATTPVPTSGYNYYLSTNNAPPTFANNGTANIPAPGTTAPLSGLTPNTTYYAWVRSNCGVASGQGIWAGPISFTTAIVTTGVTICEGGSGNLSSSSICGGFSSSMTLSGSWNTNPVAIRPLSMSNSTNCNMASTTSTYSETIFQVSVSGTYVFLMADNSAYDGFAYIVSEFFTPGVCGSGTWYVGDDDSSPIGNEPRLSIALTAGQNYKLISTVWNSSNFTLVNTFQYSITGPGSILVGSPGNVNWYTAASGGTPIGTGNTFNPVGVAGSGLPNTNTPGTTIFYAACSGTPNVRTPVNFVINARPTSVITASGSICNNDAVLNIALTGTAPWSVTYQNNIGDPAVTLNGVLTNTLTIPVTPAAAATYTITAMNDARCLSVSNSGSAIFTANTWLGGTANWTTASNWSSGVIPTASDCVIIAPTTIAATIANLDAGYASEVLVKNGGKLEVTNQRTLTITNNLRVEPTGLVNIGDSSSLLQVNNTANVGKINMIRITQLMYRYDYTYWNSPMTLASNFTLNALSPGTLSDKYFRWQPTIANGPGNWIQLPALTTNMDPTVGYIVRAPQSFSTSPAPADKTKFTATFVGTPNNGDINVLVSKGTLPAADQRDKLNLIGNPYPSAFDADMFLTTNSALIEATMYFWTHNSAISSTYTSPFYGNFAYNYSSSDYAIRNYMGGVAASSGGVAPGQFVAAGSSFFVFSKAPSGNVLFSNAMRVANNNSQFYRTSEQNVTLSPDGEMEKHRFWLNMMDNANAFSQVLIGYASGATMEYDNGFDGSRLSSEGTTFYSVIDNYNLAIQGRPLPFEFSDVVPLGYSTNLNTELSIGIESTDPLFEGIEIYLEDKVLNIMHNLKLAPYSFATTAGRFDDRFVIRYTESNLGIDGQNPQSVVNAYIKNQYLNLKTSEDFESVMIFDLTGKKVATYKPESSFRESHWWFPFAEGAYFAKIKLQTGEVVTKKLLN